MTSPTAFRLLAESDRAGSQASLLALTPALLSNAGSAAFSEGGP